MLSLAAGSGGPFAHPNAPAARTGRAPVPGAPEAVRISSERKVILMADIQKQYGLFINGEFVPAGDGATLQRTIQRMAKSSLSLRKQRRKM